MLCLADKVASSRALLCLDLEISRSVEVVAISSLSELLSLVRHFLLIPFLIVQILRLRIVACRLSHVE